MGIRVEKASVLVNNPAILINPSSVRGNHGSNLANVMGNSTSAAETQ